MRKKAFFLVILVLPLIINFVYGQKKVAFGIGSGLTLASGEGSDQWNPGFNIYGDGFKEVFKNVYVGGHFSFNRLAPKDGSGYMNITELLPGVRVVFSSKNKKSDYVFGQVGTGLILWKQHVEITTSTLGHTSHYTFESADNNFGLNVGVGINFGISSSVSLSLCPKFNIFFSEGESTKYFTINIGAVFCK